MYLAQSKTPSVAEQHARIRAAEVAVRNAAAANGWKVPEARQAELRERVEELSGGRNTVLYSEEGCPGIYVRVPAQTLPASLTAEIGTDRHEAFLVNGAEKSEFFFGKYPAAAADSDSGDLVVDPSSIPATARPLSLPGLDPVANISFDDSVTLCEQGGPGFHLVTNAEWAWLYLLTLAWGFEPRGNNNTGSDYIRTDERCDYATTASHSRSLTGSGPVAWNHDGTPYGIADLNGNIWEWCGGLRWLDGQVQVIPANNAASGADHGASSADWRAISLADGSLVAPAGATNVLHVDFDGTTPILSDETTVADFQSTQFRDLAAKDGIVLPQVVKRLGLAPLAASRPTRGRHYLSSETERLPRRGGSWSNGSIAGVATLYSNRPRGYRNAGGGCRPAFVL